MAQKLIRTIQHIGGSLGVTLPFGWINYYGSKPGDKVEIITHGITAEIKLINYNNNGERKEKIENTS
jgi:antitoxin component of MazEF toxin-antitoxin module